MARTQTMVQLSDDLLRSLDAEAIRQGTSRSDLIRRAVAAFLVEASRDAIGQQIADGYRRTPPGTPDDWAALDALADRSTIETAQRLDEEERRAGLAPW